MREVFVILGCKGAGRREVLADLLPFLKSTSTEPLIVLEHRGEFEAEETSIFSKQDSIQRFAWEINEEMEIYTDELPAGDSPICILGDGTGNPVDLIDALLNWLSEQNAELSRIVTVIHSQMASEHNVLKHWYDACMHFTDVVLFHQRDGVSNKWFSDFEEAYVKKCYPCYFNFIKKGKVKNPDEVLFPEPRRMSLVFEELEEREVFDTSTLDPEILIEDENGEVLDNIEDLRDREDDVPVDEYLEQYPNGERKKKVPDISNLFNS